MDCLVDMRLALFWNNIPKDEFELARGIIECQRADFVTYFQDTATYELHAVIVKEAFVSVLEYSKENGAEFAMLCNRPAWVLDPKKLHALVSEPAVQGKAISVRAGKINGKGFNFSPKFPYVDGDFIIINVQRCVKLGIVDAVNKRTMVSHFKSWGGIHAELASVFEAVVPYGELHVYSDGRDIQNMYGEFKHFLSSPYSYSHQYGFLSADPAQDERVHDLRAMLLTHHHISGTPVVDEYIHRHHRAGRLTVDDSGISFCRPSALKFIGDTLRIRAKQLTRSINYEIQKKYDKE